MQWEKEEEESPEFQQERDPQHHAPGLLLPLQKEPLRTLGRETPAQNRKGLPNSEAVLLLPVFDQGEGQLLCQWRRAVAPLPDA